MLNFFSGTSHGRFCGVWYCVRVLIGSSSLGCLYAVLLLLRHRDNLLSANHSCCNFCRAIDLALRIFDECEGSKARLLGWTTRGNASIHADRAPRSAPLRVARRPPPMDSTFSTPTATYSYVGTAVSSRPCSHRDGGIGLMSWHLWAPTRLRKMPVRLLTEILRWSASYLR